MKPLRTRGINPRLVLASLVAGMTLSLVVSEAHSQRQQTFDFADLLLERAFVVEATVPSLPSTSAEPIPVRVEAVLLGTVPNETIIVPVSVSNWPPDVLLPGVQILLSGSFYPDRGDTCSCNFMVIGNDGALHSQYPISVSGVDYISLFRKRPLTLPETYEQLRTHIEHNVTKHAANWLASGSDIAIVEVTTVARANRTIELSLVGSLSGKAHGSPKIIAWNSPPNCMFSPIKGFRLVIPITEHVGDTLAVDCCLERLVIQPDGLVPILGLRLPQIGKAFSSSEKGLSLRGVRHSD